jgi:hypothetical protein
VEAVILESLEGVIRRVFEPWRVIDVAQKEDEIFVYTAMSMKVFYAHRDPSSLIRVMQPRVIPRAHYSGRYAPRAMMRKRAGL